VLRNTSMMAIAMALRTRDGAMRNASSTNREHSREEAAGRGFCPFPIKKEGAGFFS